MMGALCPGNQKKKELVARVHYISRCKEALCLQKLINDISSPPIYPIVWLEELIAEINYEKGNTEQLSMFDSTLPPTILYSDNQAAIETVKMEGLKARTTHSDIRLMSSRDLWKKGFV
jgi:hypothetical protein